MNYQNFNEEVFRTKLSELDWSFVSENKDRNISFEIVCYYHVTYEFQSESIHPVVCLNVKELLT